MRAITITIIVILFAFVSTTSAQTATKINAVYFSPSEKFVNIDADTNSIEIEILPTKGSRIYVEMTYTYTAKNLSIDKLNTLASVAYQQGRFEVTYLKDTLKIWKTKSNVIFATDKEGKKCEIIEGARMKIYIPETINFVGM